VLSIHSFESDKSPYQQFTTNYAKELQKHTHKITSKRIKEQHTRKAKTIELSYHR